MLKVGKEGEGNFPNRVEILKEWIWGIQSPSIMLVWGPISRWYLGIWISGPNEISACIWIMNKQPFSKLVTVGYISERLVKDYKISLWHLLASYLLTHTHKYARTHTHTPPVCRELSLLGLTGEALRKDFTHSWLNLSILVTTIQTALIMQMFFKVRNTSSS